MLLSLDAGNLPESLFKSASQYSGQHSQSSKKAILTLDPEYGTGHFRAIAFDHNISLLQLSLKAKEPVNIHLNHKDDNILCFGFCLQGQFAFAGEDGTSDRLITPLDGCISTKIPDKPLHLIFPAEKDLKCVIIIIDKQRFLAKAEREGTELPAALHPLFLQDHDHQGYFRQLGKNSEMAQIANNIFQADGNLFHEYLALEATVLQVLAQQMTQLDQEENGNNDHVKMSRYDLERILEARQELLSDLRQPPTIKVLSRKVGINEHKLKKGFKEVFKNTIYQCLIDERFKYAQELLEEGKLNISQIAEKIGYSNKSHFTNKFKSIYGVLPKDYIKGLNAEKSEYRMAAQN